MATSIEFGRLFGKLRQYPLPVLSGLVILVCGIALFTRSAALEATAEELRQKEEEWDRMNNNLKRSRDLEAHLAAITTAHETVQGRLMNPEQRAINDDYFYRLEQESGLRLTALNQSGVVATKGSAIAGLAEFKQYQVIGYSISVEGSFDSCIRFVTALANGRHFARISGFSVARAQKGTPGQLVVNLQVQMLGVPVES